MLQKSLNKILTTIPDLKGYEGFKLFLSSEALQRLIAYNAYSPLVMSVRKWDGNLKILEQKVFKDPVEHAALIPWAFSDAAKAMQLDEKSRISKILQTKEAGTKLSGADAQALVQVFNEGYLAANHLAGDKPENYPFQSAATLNFTG